MYLDAKKQQKIAESITEKADEIEGYVSQIITVKLQSRMEVVCWARTICRKFSRAFGAALMRKTFAAAGWELYICRQLMRKMNGEIFAKIDDDIITVTTVFARG